MARPNKYDAERFGRFDGLLPNVSGKIEPLRDGKPKELDVKNLPAGEWVERGVYRTETIVPYGRTYGSSIFSQPEQNLHLLKEWGAGERSVFLDLETTGLSGGTGTYAFMVGLGFCEGDHFKVVQLFLAGPGWEKNWLSVLESELPERYGLVTYNGRTFDLPLLRTRYTLLRAAPSWNAAPHMDLLLLSRHFYRGRYLSCSLSSIESNVLGVHRSGEDIPGREIPYIYTQFLKSSDAGPLRGVFYHNTLDIISLAALQAKIGSLLSMEDCSGEDLIRCGDLLHMKGRQEEAHSAWEQAMQSAEASWKANLRFAEHYKGLGDYENAREHYVRALEKELLPLDTLENLAKLEEHHFKNYASALAYAERALEWLDSCRAIRDYKWKLERHNVSYRIERLKRKVSGKGDDDTI